MTNTSARRLARLHKLRAQTGGYVVTTLSRRARGRGVWSGMVERHRTESWDELPLPVPVRRDFAWRLRWWHRDGHQPARAREVLAVALVDGHQKPRGSERPGSTT